MTDTGAHNVTGRLGDLAYITQIGNRANKKAHVLISDTLDDPMLGATYCGLRWFLWSPFGVQYELLTEVQAQPIGVCKTCLKAKQAELQR